MFYQICIIPEKLKFIMLKLIACSDTKEQIKKIIVIDFYIKTIFYSFLI